MLSSFFKFPKSVLWNIESVPQFYLQMQKRIYLISALVKLLIYINYRKKIHISFFWIICMCYINTNVLFTNVICCLLFIYIYVKKISYFVFIIHQVNNHRVSRRWLTETDVKHLNSSALGTITNTNRSIVNWKKKNEFLHRCISKILFIDTEKLSKIQISLQVFFKGFAERFRITYLKNGFFVFQRFCG